MDRKRWEPLDGIFFKWDAGPPRSRILARLYRPEDCLPAAGYEFRNEKNITVRAKDLSLPFRALEFDYHGKDVYVFYCLWQGAIREAASSA
jgi:hypothetical protein